jgi:hypothetical protein
MNGFVGKWVRFNAELELNHGLDVDQDAHIWLLHYLFRDAINQDAQEWAGAWNRHSMRLPRGQRGGRSPLDQFLFGMAQHGIRGLQHSDELYVEDGDEYGVDWEDLNNTSLAQSVLQRELATSVLDTPAAAAPPRWSQVDVETLHLSPLGEEQIQQLDHYLSSRVDITSTSMEVRKLLWIHALRFFGQLMV